MSTNIGDTIAPNSDQLDAVDLLGGPQTFTIERVDVNPGAEQPVTVHLREFPRPWRPGLSMRRVLVGGWGPDSAPWGGRRVTLYCDLKVRFGGVDVGGTRISHLSHIDKPLSVPLIVTRGKSAVFTVQPLKEAPRPDYDALVTAATTEDECRALWSQARDASHLTPELDATIKARAAQFTTPNEG